MTERPASVMRAEDGTVVEVFEWRRPTRSSGPRRARPSAPLWGEFAAACDYVPLSGLPEAQRMFAEFDAIAS